jgi:hypothetical protein
MKRLAVVGVAVALVCGVGGTAGAEAPEEHCVVHVIGQEASGELILSEEECYSSFAAAMTAEKVGAFGDGAAALAEAAGVLTFTIGTHYEYAGFGGSSMSVVGSDCTGGWLNVSAAWNNRISSTRHGCPRIRHHSGYDLTGSSQTTLAPGGNLTTLDNLTSSIQYLT